MSLSLIGRDGTERRRCEWCDRMRADTYCINPTQRKVSRKYLCEECHCFLVGKAIADYVLQLDAGVPEDRLTVLTPWRVFSGRMQKQLCESFSKLKYARVG
jgi:hypothetical protein